MKFLKNIKDYLLNPGSDEVSSKRMDLSLTILMFTILWVIQVIYFMIFDPGYNYGYEFGKVANSMLDGKGYSNPWNRITGPTAAVLPFLVYYYYILLGLFGETFTMYLVASIIKFFAYAVSYYFTVRALRLSKIKVYSLVLFPLFLLFILFSPTLNFEHTGDLWLWVYLVAWFIFALIHFFRGSRKIGGIHLFLFMLITPLANPAIALAGLTTYGIVSLVEYYPSFFKVTENNVRILRLSNIDYPGLLKFIRVISVFTLAFCLPIAMWSVRNYIVFDRFIPTKSNMWMEYHASNMIDEDGILSASTTALSHPSGSDSLRNIMKENGELYLMDYYLEIGTKHRREHFDLYVKKTFNRFLNAFVFSKYDMDVVPSRGEEYFNPKDWKELTDRKILVYGIWTNVSLQDEEFMDLINGIPLEDRDGVYKEWKGARNYFIAQKHSWRTYFRGFMLGLIPTLSILIVLLFAKEKKNILFLSSVFFYIIYIFPYLLISHQLRYQRPVLVIHVILIYFLLIFTFNKVFKTR